MDISFLFQPGLYKITCLKNSKVYFGESANLFARLGQHTQSLEAQQHDCKALQTDFNRYGKKNFRFEIVSDCLKKPFTGRALRQHYESLFTSLSRLDGIISRQIAQSITLFHQRKVSKSKARFSQVDEQQLFF